MTHQKNHRRKKRTSKNNMINKTLERSVSGAKFVSKKYMPKIKNGIEHIGNKVVKTGEKSVPFLQNITKKFFNMFSGKTKKRH